MKRLVVCCDGTWKAESSTTVSNIIKIAETVAFDAKGPLGQRIQQWVSYVSGPGARGFLADRLMGGAFGLGLDANLSAAYWHLALNWEPGDEIYIFGFSRGAYTARSLAGLIHRVGLLTPAAMIGGEYPNALRIYRWPLPADGVEPAAWRDFRERHCQHPIKIDFLGVFDTVGALGVPGLGAFRRGFHDVRLTPNVHCARQALAIDERRRIFEPCLWEVPVVPNIKYSKRIERVKQVWFEGVHSDIGGGYRECGLSDITLRWMIREAEEVGLVFDVDRLNHLAAECRAKDRHLHLHNSLSAAYRVLNLMRAMRHPRNRRFQRDSWRRLCLPTDRCVRIASSTQDVRDYAPPNVRSWRDELDGAFPEELIEKTELA
ncbi:DUF2235 domain-containing protein [Nocardia arthritidis]|uniref:DUF2235 domain-containing protein n=1 Tax=Nocardia arthritidis TaxID=228602 RepID=A0A6G9YDB6_9NOCA|nr:DUF2235 domain-containing protein [Nocardia arthritidis]QIS11003.1 DUF2235 domain-containing protein [Nocardia arthritidis]